MITNIILITAIILCVVTCLFPGAMISHVVLAGPGTENYSLLRKYVTATVVSLFTGLSCTIAFIILVPLTIIGAVLIFALVAVSEIVSMLNGR